MSRWQTAIAKARQFDPRSISGLAVWLDASNASTITIDAGKVSQWNDLSGNGRNASQPTAANRPAYDTTLAGRNVVTTSNSPATNIFVANPISSHTGVTIFAVLQNTGTSNRFISLGTSSSAESIGAGSLGWVPLYRHAVGQAAGYADGANRSIVPGGFATNEAAVFTLTNNGTQIANFKNGFPGAVSSGIAGISASFARLWVSGRSDGSVDASSQNVGEVLVYNRILTPSERIRVERWLGAKWSLAVYTPPDYSDADANAYITAVETADGGLMLETGVRNAMNAFITGCKADGIWSAIKASCILAGARTLSGALTPLVGAAPTNANFVSADYNRKTGLIGNATNKHLDSNRGNDTDPQDNQHLALWIRTVSAGEGRTLIGSPNATGRGPSRISSNVGSVQFRSRNNTTGAFSPSLSLPGFLGVSRSSSSSFSSRHSGAASTETISSVLPVTANIGVFGQVGTTTAGTSARLAYYSIGESLDLALLESRVSALMTSLNAAIP